MAKKQRRRVRDTWKEKSWYTIKTPVAFGDKEIGTTPARDPELVYGRTVEVTPRTCIRKNCRSNHERINR